MPLAYHHTTRWIAAPMVGALLLVGACGSSPSSRDAAHDESGGPSSSAIPSTQIAGTPQRSAPTAAFPVGVRTLDLHRGSDRPLPTMVWYPATGAATRAGAARQGAPVAAGRFPVVLASHGLGALPADLSQLTTRIVAAGFIVAAPAYPKTNRNAGSPNMLDVANQPADAFFVIDAVVRLGERSGDPLSGHVDADHIAAAGHSAGGYTTTGMLTTKHASSLKAGVVISGACLGTYSDPPASVLFVHGDRDTVVSYESGRSAYDRMNWPKGFLTVVGGDHTSFLEPNHAAFTPTVKTVTDFLRATLYGDATARSRLNADATSAATRYEQRQLG